VRLGSIDVAPDPSAVELGAEGDEHRKAQERDRSRVRRQEGVKRNRFYARKRWAMTRKAKLFATPLCELEHPGCLGIANEVHHRIAMEDGGAEYTLDNLVSVIPHGGTGPPSRDVPVEAPQGYGDGPSWFPTGAEPCGTQPVTAQPIRCSQLPQTGGTGGSRSPTPPSPRRRVGQLIGNDETSDPNGPQSTP
jgi:hypothetical protein